MKPVFALLASWLLIDVQSTHALPPPPKMYTERNKFEQAMKEYQDRKDSYTNFIRKKDFFSSFKYSASRAASIPSDQLKDEIIVKALGSVGVSLDNYMIRYRPGVEPEAVVYFNFYSVPGKEFLTITLLDESDPSAIYSAQTYRFSDPGDPPIWSGRSNDPVTTSTRSAASDPPTSQSTAVDEYYILPNGLKYSRAELEKQLPSFTSSEVLVRNFPNANK